MKIKLYKVLTCAMLVMLVTVSLFTVSADSLAVVDDADVFTPEQEAELSLRIEEIRDEYDFDVTIITTEDTGGETLKEYSEDHSALDLSNDGLVFIHDVNAREYYTVSRGHGVSVVTNKALDRIDDVVVPYLKDGDFYGAHSSYLDVTDVFLEAAESGEGYSGEGMSLMDYLIPIGIGLVGGLLIAFIITGGMKASMNTARKKEEAANYVVNGTFNLAQSYDRFLYQHTTKTARAKDNDSGGGGSSRGGHGGGSY